MSLKYIPFLKGCKNRRSLLMEFTQQKYIIPTIQSFGGNTGLVFGKLASLKTGRWA